MYVMKQKIYIYTENDEQRQRLFDYLRKCKSNITYGNIALPKNGEYQVYQCIMDKNDRKVIAVNEKLEHADDKIMSVDQFINDHTLHQNKDEVIYDKNERKEKEPDQATKQKDHLQKQKERQLIYENRQEMLADLRRHLDDVYNAFALEHGINDRNWFDWSDALYTSANYLDAYLQTVPHTHPIVLPCALVDETCEDVVQAQYEKEREKDAELCIEK